MKTSEIKKYKGISIMNQNRSLKYDRKEREKTTMYDNKLCEGAGKRIRLRASTCS